MLIQSEDFDKFGNGDSEEVIETHLANQAVPLYIKGNELVGCVRPDHKRDDTLKASENVKLKVSGGFAVFGPAPIQWTKTDGISRNPQPILSPRHISCRALSRLRHL